MEKKNSSNKRDSLFFKLFTLGKFGQRDVPSGDHYINKGAPINEYIVTSLFLEIMRIYIKKFALYMFSSSLF